jgi:hypothetical protein
VLEVGNQPTGLSFLSFLETLELLWWRQVQHLCVFRCLILISTAKIHSPRFWVDSFWVPPLLNLNLEDVAV